MPADSSNASGARTKYAVMPEDTATSSIAAAAIEPTRRQLTIVHSGTPVLSRRAPNRGRTTLSFSIPVAIPRPQVGGGCDLPPQVGRARLQLAYAGQLGAQIVRALEQLFQPGPLLIRERSVDEVVQAADWLRLRSLVQRLPQ